MPIELGPAVTVIMRDELSHKTSGAREVDDVLEADIPSVSWAGKVVKTGEIAGG